MPTLLKIDDLKVLEMGPSRDIKSELKVNLRDIRNSKPFRCKCLVKGTFL